MDRDQYLDVTAEAVTVIARTAGSAPAQPVPTCPGWRLRDLGFHVACVLSLWTDVVRRADTERNPFGHGMDAPADHHLESFVRSRGEAFVDVLRDADDDTPAWNWWGDAIARHIPRRVAHEAIIHGWDATNAVGRADEIAPPLAADGIIEFFEVMMPYTGRPPQGLAGTVALTATDTGERWVVDIGPGALPSIVSGEAADGIRTTVTGGAADLLLLLWRRRTSEDLLITGDTDFIRAFLAYPTLR